MSTKGKGETPQNVKGLGKEQKTYCLTFSIPARLLNQLTIMGRVFIVLVVSGCWSLGLLLNSWELGANILKQLSSLKHTRHLAN